MRRRKNCRLHDPPGVFLPTGSCRRDADRLSDRGRCPGSPAGPMGGAGAQGLSGHAIGITIEATVITNKLNGRPTRMKSVNR